MPDYTPEGIRGLQLDTLVATAHLMDKKLKKINSKLALLTLLGGAIAFMKYKEFVKVVEKTKGE